MNPLLSKIGVVLAVVAGSTVPLVPSELTLTKAYQYDANKYVEYIMPELRSSTTNEVVRAAVPNPQKRFTDDDANGKISVAEFKDKNGGTVYYQMSDSVYAKMGNIGGVSWNPKKTEFLTLLDLLGAQKAEAAIAIATSTDGVYTASASSVTTPVTMSGSDTLLYVHVNDDGQNISSATYNGVSMTVLANYDDGYYASAHYYLVAPTTGTNNLVVTLSATSPSTVLALGLSGVNQSTPINASSTDGYLNDWTDRGATLTTTVDGCGVFTVAMLDNRSIVAGDANSTFVSGVIYPGYNYIVGLVRSATFPQPTAGSILVTLDALTGSWGRAYSVAFAPATGGGAASYGDGPKLFITE